MDRMEGKCTMRVTSLGTGEWVVKTICCGYEDTTQFCETWELAEQFRHDMGITEGPEHSTECEWCGSQEHDDEQCPKSEECDK
jgi:hypothetical protein